MMFLRVLLASALLWVGSAQAQMNSFFPGPGMAHSTGCADSNVIAWKAAVVGAGGSVSSGRETLVCTTIGNLKSHGCFATYDRLWFYAAENAQSAQYDFVAASAHTVNGTPTFTTDRGYQQGATSDYINTNASLSSLTNYTQNGASLSAYVQTARTSSNNSIAFGAQDSAGTGNQSSMHPYFGSNVFWAVNNSGNGFDSSANADAAGMYTLNRSAASGAGANDVYKNSNSTALATGISTSVARPALNMFVLSQNINGSNNPASTTGDRVAMFAIGGSVGNGSAIAQCQTDINTYMTAVGANVY